MEKPRFYMIKHYMKHIEELTLIIQFLENTINDTKKVRKLRLQEFKNNKLELQELIKKEVNRK